MAERGCHLQIICDVYRVYLVSQEQVLDVNTLLLPSSVDGDGAWVCHHHDAGYQLLFLHQGRGDEGDNVQSLVLLPFQLCHHHQQIVRREDSTLGKWTGKINHT